MRGVCLGRPTQRVTLGAVGCHKALVLGGLRQAQGGVGIGSVQLPASTRGGINMGRCGCCYRDPSLLSLSLAKTKDTSVSVGDPKLGRDPGNSMQISLRQTSRIAVNVEWEG